MLATDIQHKIDFKTKPLGSLGTLEKLSFQISTIQQSLSPRLTNPTIIVFAGDHGIANEGVSAYPQEVTFQMVMNFLNGGAAINVFCRQNNIDLLVVDAGVNFDFEPNPKLLNTKVGNGTKSFLKSQAMTSEETKRCLSYGETIVNDLAKSGCNVIGFGEMGIGNTSSATMLMSHFCNLPIEDCVGRGTGLNDSQLANKINVLKKAQVLHTQFDSVESVLQTFGGFEIAQMCGAMMAAHNQNMVILVDGFIATAAFLVASKLSPEIKSNAIFCHLSDEFGHRNLLSYLGVEPLLQLNMRLGEGSGCAVAYPIIESAVAFLNQMASFESAGVSNK